MTRGNLGDLQPFDPEIDRTFHRLVRHSVYPGHFVHCEHSEHSVEDDSEYSDFEHSNVWSLFDNYTTLKWKLFDPFAGVI